MEAWRTSLADAIARSPQVEIYLITFYFCFTDVIKLCIAQVITPLLVRYRHGEGCMLASEKVVWRLSLVMKNHAVYKDHLVDRIAIRIE